MAQSKLTQFLSAYLDAGGVSPEAILRAFVSVLPDALVPRAAKLSYQVGDELTRDRLQLGLRLRLGDADQTMRLSKALKAVSASDEPDKDKALLFVELVSWFPEPLPDPLVEEAQAFVEHLGDDVVRTQALVALAPHLPVTMKHSA